MRDGTSTISTDRASVLSSSLSLSRASVNGSFLLLPSRWRAAANPGRCGGWKPYLTKPGSHSGNPIVCTVYRARLMHLRRRPASELLRRKPRNVGGRGCEDTARLVPPRRSSRSLRNFDIKATPPANIRRCHDRLPQLILLHVVNLK